MSLACLSGMFSGSTPAEKEGRTQEWTEGGVGFYTIPKTSSAHLVGSLDLECEGTRPLTWSSGSAAQKGAWLWQDSSLQ